MGVVFIAFLMPVLAQADQANELKIYEITPNEGGESYFAIIDNVASDPLRLRIYYKPGKNLDDKETVSKSQVTYNFVGKVGADNEIRRREEKVRQVINGVVVENYEVKLAEDARASAKALEDHLKVPDPTPVDPAMDTDVPPADPGPLAYRMPQIALVLGALVLIGIIIKLLILG